MTLALDRQTGEVKPEGPEQGTELSMAGHDTESQVSTVALMEVVVGDVNMRSALQQVRTNKGAPGADGMTVAQLPQYLRKHWRELREQLLSGSYEP